MMLPVTDTTPTLIHVEGRPMAWLIDGRLRPYIAGGAGEGEGGDGGAGEGAGEGVGSGEGEGAGTGDQGEGDGSGGSDASSKKVEMTQAELDELIKREKGKATKAEAKRLQDEADAAGRSDLEKAQAAQAEAEKKATAAQAAADARIVRADAKLAAAAAGVDPARVDAFLRTIDLTDVEVDDKGDTDTKALAKVIKDGLTAIPEFKATKGTGRSGGDHSGGTEEGKPKDLASAVAARLAS